MKHRQQINWQWGRSQAGLDRRLVSLIALLIAALGGWASFASLDEIVRGTGRIVPATANQTVQNLEGGIVRQIYVKEGDVVEAQQLIADMDKTRFQSAYQELQDQYWALSIKLNRLEAEADLKKPFSLDPDLAALAPEHAASELQLFSARRDEFLVETESLADAVELKAKEVKMLRTMVNKEAVPRIDLLRAEQALVDIRSRMKAAYTSFESARAQEYSETLGKLRQVKEQRHSRKDQLRRTEVRSPIRGVVNKVLVTTIGGVVQPGDPLVEILSLDDSLRVEGRISPRDIGFVYVGMPARIKLTAFDFSIYGSLKGSVAHVGADTVVDLQQSTPQPYYEVYIELEKTFVTGAAGRLDIRPGMQAEIELHSGDKTVLQYLLKPLFKASEALTER